MISWPTPFIPAVPGQGRPLRLHDTSSGELHTIDPGPVARIYVCGITPYDATHLGHAATYVTFDLVGRALRDAGHGVTYVQNVTDVDDPLLERAARDGVSWSDLAAGQIALFREDMTALAVIPPDHYVGVVESIDAVATSVRDLLATGKAYLVAADDADGSDIYLDLTQQSSFGSVSRWDRAEMFEVYADRGGDPERGGKRDPLDPLLWRAARDGEPSWPDDRLGAGRPGWHVECTTIALDYLGMPFDIQGGGTDLVFPHHEMSAVQAVALKDTAVFARSYVHQAMVGLDGEKMSKSKGNLVLVSRMRAEGVDPTAIRLLLLEHHYRTPWEFAPQALDAALERLARWRAAVSVNSGPSAEATIEVVRDAVADDLDTLTALQAVDAWAERSLSAGGDDIGAPGLLARALDAILGVRL